MLGAANMASYTLVLVGLFVLASGIAVLQVAANPLAAALGDPKGSHFRLTLLVGAVADEAGYVAAFRVPAACYLVLWLFAVSAGRVRPMRQVDPVAVQ
jgi:fucose permease